MCPNGLAILQDSVKRRFPADDTWVEWDYPRAFEYQSTVADLVQEIVQRHASGIEFREYNVSSLPGPTVRYKRTDGFRPDLISIWTCTTRGSTRRSGSTGRLGSFTVETGTTAGKLLVVLRIWPIAHDHRTWMDKNGSSDKAGNKGLPATPRDGSPIEITGLLKSTLTWLDGLVSKGTFPHKGVKATSTFDRCPTSPLST